ncbi:MAG: PIN domain-containing protein [Micrococcales bacterium]|nr:PIN domain-containing protein [Micrococcales bacterium]
MARAVLDTNVLLDYLDSARPEHATATEVVRALTLQGVGLCVPATSLKDVYYILTRVAGEPVARQAVRVLVRATSVLTIDETTCRDALESNEPDFEDGLILASALAAGARWIVTRDGAAFAHGPVEAISPSNLLAHLAP